jgi:predicted transcriptional regulator
MTIRLTPSQVECLRLIKRGVKSSPPLIHKIVQALINKGYVNENRLNGRVIYIVTEKGQAFL